MTKTVEVVTHTHTQYNLIDKKITEIISFILMYMK